jgi:Uma2 family endonuclease
MLHALKRQEKYTYADYLTWDDGERWELIDGIAYNMSPAPTRRHQDILVEILKQTAVFLTDKTCNVYVAPFDVRFPESVIDYEDDDIIDVVQPDIVVVCDTSKLDDKGCVGAPDFIIEILSPSTADKDKGVKLKLYEKNDVKEYWIIDPNRDSVAVYLLRKSGRYGKPLVHTGKGKLEVKTLAGLVIDLDMVFRKL